MNRSTKTTMQRKSLHLSAFKQASPKPQALLGPFLHCKDHPPEEPWLEVQLLVDVLCLGLQDLQVGWHWPVQLLLNSQVQIMNIWSMRWHLQIAVKEEVTRCKVRGDRGPVTAWPTPLACPVGQHPVAEDGGQEGKGQVGGVDPGPILKKVVGYKRALWNHSGI